MVSRSAVQTYNGLLSSVQKRLSKGLMISGNWTWSHCIGVFQGYDSKSDETATVPNNPNFDRGNCDSDRRHIVNHNDCGHHSRVRQSHGCGCW